MDINKYFDGDKRIAVLKMNRPDRLNSMTPNMTVEMCAALKEADTRSDISVVIISGEGSAFCAGSDLKERLKNAPSADGSDPYLMQIRRMNALIESLSKPVIAAMNGHSIGAGLELALSCDIRIAAVNAKIGLTEAKVGTIAGGGGTQRLPRLIGVGRALEMLFTGERLKGREAYEIGLVNHVAEDDMVMVKALELAETIAANAPLSLKAYKHVVREGVKLSLEEGLDMEMRAANELAKSLDREEGMKAFLEKRKPEFKGM